MTRILTIIALLFATPAWALPKCSSFIDVNTICMNLNEKLHGGYIGELKNGVRSGVGSEPVPGGRRIAFFENGSVSGWTVSDGELGSSFIKYKGGVRQEGILLKNNQPFATFKKSLGGKPSDMVLGKVFFPDGRVFKGEFLLDSKNEFRFPDQKVDGVFVFPDYSDKEKYFGGVEFWRKGEIDLDGFGIIKMRNGTSANRDFVREFPGKSMELPPMASVGNAIAGIITLGLITAKQTKDRLGAGKLEADMLSLEAKVENALRDFSISTDVAHLTEQYNAKIKESELEETAMSIESYRRHCREFGYSEFDAEGNVLPQFRECLKETFYKMEEIRTLREAKRMEVEQQAASDAEEMRIKRNEVELQKSLALSQIKSQKSQRSLNAINSYLDREYARINALNKSLRGNAPVICSTGPAVGGYLNTTCR